MRADSIASLKPFSPVRPDVQFPRQEDEILRHWDERRIFEQSLEQTAGAEPFNFYDGPPFATGLPHYGHILAGVLKDIVPRYWTMKGRHVTRRFGWDCHGLPVEYEINKSLGLESRKQILEHGVDRYNAACRGIVQRYSEEWKKTVRRVGRWVDMENGYFTMDVSFMQSVWWVFQQLWEKGLIYEGHKVVPYSVGLSTPLSNFEANLNYKQTQDPALTVTFPLLDEPETAILAWTTTPWTLPSNLGLAVGRTIDYVKVREKESGRQFILAATLLPSVFKDDAAEVLETFPGEKLLGRRYQPIFPFFADRAERGAFRVIHSDHVTTDSGTGVVHMAPAFGEDDYYACLREGIELVNPVDDDGTFTAEVAPWTGRKVKEADKEIIAELKKSGRLFKQDTILHSYPFCWRTDTPLIYRAVSSWFVAVEKIKDRIVAANQTTRWVPEHLRDGRFGNWLENARDWAISRNRFWGTPLPIWRNAEGEVICIGSREELERLSGEKIEDLHIDRIDSVRIPSPTGKSPLQRIEGVLDCWFESGSMPFAQWGYPYAHPEALEERFPADFIAEGLDQTRGWFYTLMVIGAALYDRAPFRNVIVNGLILAEDGKKMSKSLRNYPDPMEVLDKHGADALRLYLIDSPVVKAQELRFSEAGVRDVARKVLVRWWNSYSFFVNYANVDGFRPKVDAHDSPNVLDQWVLSRLHGLIETTNREMAAYRLYNVVPALLGFIEDLTNTYIRFNRPHFAQEGMPEDKRFAFETLYEVLHTLSVVMAPFAPFLAETTYQNLASVHPAGGKESVHLERFPEADTRLLRPELEEAVAAMVALVTLGRNQRDKIGVRAKIPLRSLRIVHREERVLENLRKFERYFQDELNVQSVEYDRHEDKFVQITAKANFPALGPRLGARMKTVAGAIARLQLDDILRLEHGETITVEGEPITAADVEIRRAPRGDRPNLAVHQVVSIELDPTVTPEQEREGLAREVIRNVQAARKSADFLLDDRIRVELRCDGLLRQAIEAHQEMIAAETLSVSLALVDDPAGDFRTEAEVDGQALQLAVARQPR
ncbi:isoleucine--tRNA ligase [Vulgatibacter incomptus]|uniref:Isoleucine--tRNA ligase n=1 Tax=Vulgatibacter incomptus TaxID=1391653 RepID=A0A0K1PB94_9BACT|nr:isoleucine--tRNA ligase [Vulgatibacter incomptus]AKU90803.1 Isoleucyl-tRNA synthetase [Vulgatibacter incomptus]